MEITWSALENPFVNVTKNSNKMAMSLSNYHEAFLKQLTINDPGDLDWPILHSRYEPLHTTLTDIYIEWKNMDALKESKTDVLDALMENMTENINEYDLQVQVVYRKTNPQYTQYFPDGHKPFHNGTITDKILAVKALGQSMNGDPALAAIKALVDAFYGQLNTARDLQEAAKAQVATLSNDVAKAVTAAMQMQWRNFGFLINKYFETPEQIEPFFEISILTKKPQTKFTATLAIGENKHVFTRTLTFDTELRIKITGPGPVNLYLATTKNGTDSTAVPISADTEQTIEASAFGITEYGLHRHLTAINDSGAETHIEVEVE